jgi:hypothetical protein
LEIDFRASDGGDDAIEHGVFRLAAGIASNRGGAADPVGLTRYINHRMLSTTYDAGICTHGLKGVLAETHHLVGKVRFYQ